MKYPLIIFIFFLAAYSDLRAGQKVTRISDVIYDHRDGVALVFDVLVPEKQNGIAVFKMVSGGWASCNAAFVSENEVKEFTDHGETVFLISHGSKPRFKVPEIVGQIQRAIQYVRFNAKRFGVDPDRFAITGGSSGGHLSVSAAVFGKDGMSEKEYRKIHSLKQTDQVDPVNLVSSKVQAVACFFPPTNLVDYNHADSTFADFPNVSVFVDAFDISKETSRETRREIFKKSSPYFFIDKTSPPMLIFQGTKDLLVPYMQSVRLIEKLKENAVPCKLILNKGAAHGWPYKKSDDEAMVHWFEKYLPEKQGK